MKVSDLPPPLALWRVDARLARRPGMAQAPRAFAVLATSNEDAGRRVLERHPSARVEGAARVLDGVLEL